MEAGFDYLLLRGRPRRRFLSFSGIFLFLFGAMLLASSGAYYGYAAQARADLDTLNVTLPGSAPGAIQTTSLAGMSASQGPGDPATTLASSKPGNGGPDGLASPAASSVTSKQQEAAGGAASSAGSSTTPSGIPSLAETDSQELGQGSSGAVASAAAIALPGQPAPAGGSPSTVGAMPASAISSQRLYPGGSLLANFWSNPLSYESASYREKVLLQGFTPLDPTLGLPLDGGSVATRIIIPSIEVDSAITELAILDMGSSRAYETPSHTVGHIPETANSGEAGSAWFFGHTESPILGEGSVFFNLSKVPGKLSHGEDVFVVTDDGQHQYLYRITSTRVVHQRDMRLYDTGQATIHLVSCVPRLVYDHRLIVTGELVGRK